VTGLKDKFVDVLMDRQPVRAIGVAHALMRPFVDPGCFPIRPSMCCENSATITNQHGRATSL
jgi:hypothetical protein